MDTPSQDDTSVDPRRSASLRGRLLAPLIGAACVVVVAGAWVLSAGALPTAVWLVAYVGLATAALSLAGVWLFGSVQRLVLDPLEALLGVAGAHWPGDPGVQLPRQLGSVELNAFSVELQQILEAGARETRELQRSSSELRLLGQLARIADRAEDFEEALGRSCAQISRFLCWPISHVYLVDTSDPRQLVPSDIWHSSCPDLAASFMDRTRALRPRAGEELSGRVLERQEPVWVEDARDVEWFERTRGAQGEVRSAVGFPIFQAQEIIGVLELFDLEPREREVHHVALMHSIGLTLGQVLGRRRTHSLLVRRNLELAEALREAESSTRAKSAFLANMSHEIRTPMTAILGSADLLLTSDQADTRAEYISTIRRNGRHLLQLINDILDFSKIEAGRMEIETIECDVAEVFNGVYEAMDAKADERNLELEIALDTPIPETIQTDPTRLRQILLNLVSNAVKFTENGRVRVSLRIVEPELLTVVVEDTGIGMSDAQVSKLFNPFSQADMSMTRRFGGTGLGLSISKSLVELLGGEILAVSTEGVGSRFEFTLPTGPIEGVNRMSELPELSPPTLTDAKVFATEREQPLAGQRILLAEDGLDNQRLLGRILTLAGAKVDIVENGSLAVDRALEARSNHEPFDLVLMDMQMPVMDGYEATRTLRRHGVHIPIVAITAHAMRGERERCMAAGCDDFFAKPIPRDELVNALAQILG